MPSGTSHTGPNPAGAPAVSWRVECADCLTLLPGLEADSFGAVITDAPYGIDFHDEAWDGRAIDEAAAAASGGIQVGRQEGFQRWCALWGAECLRVLLPGGHLLCFAAPRMAHRLGCGLEEAGFEVRDTLMWVFGTGMPKSRHLGEGRSADLKPASAYPLYSATATCEPAYALKPKVSPRLPPQPPHAA